MIFSQRLGQSQKPVDIYELIERMVPNGKEWCALDSFRILLRGIRSSKQSA